MKRIWKHILMLKRQQNLDGSCATASLKVWNWLLTPPSNFAHSAGIFLWDRKQTHTHSHTRGDRVVCVFVMEGKTRLSSFWTPGCYCRSVCLSPYCALIFCRSAAENTNVLKRKQYTDRFTLTIKRESINLASSFNLYPSVCPTTD